MMDAVTGLTHHRLAMSESAEKKARNKVVVKDEPQDEDAWKSLPAVDEAALSTARSRAASPLEMKGNGVDSMEAIAKPEMNNHAAINNSTSEPKTTVSAPARPRMRQPAQNQAPLTADTGADLDDAARKLKELDLYDFKDSSSPTSTTSSVPSDQPAIPATKSSLPPPRTNRRHSSIPKDALDSTGDSKRSRPASRTSSATSAASRRRSMMT